MCFHAGAAGRGREPAHERGLRGRADLRRPDAAGACDGNLVLIPDASSAEAVCYLLSLFGNSIKQQKLYSDLIKGASEEEAVQRISVANLSFPPYMLAAVLRPSYFRESEFLHDVLMPAVSAILPNSPKLYQKGTIVALLESDRLGSVPEELMSQLRRLAAENGVLVGISNMFTRPERFAVYYRQAAQTAGFSKRQNNVSGVFLYSDCAFYLMLDGGAHVPAPEHGELPHTADIGALRPGLFGQRADVQAAILLPRGLLPEAPLPDPPTRPAGGEGLTAGVVAVCWKIHPISLVLPKERRFWGRTDARTLVAPPASPTCAWRPCRTHASPWASGRPTPGRGWNPAPTGVFCVVPFVFTARSSNPRVVEDADPYGVRVTDVSALPYTRTV